MSTKGFTTTPLNEYTREALQVIGALIRERENASGALVTESKGNAKGELQAEKWSKAGGARLVEQGWWSKAGGTLLMKNGQC